MLQLALVLLIFTLASTLLGFTGVAAAAADMAAVLFCIFSLLLSLSFVAALRFELKYRVGKRY